MASHGITYTIKRYTLLPDVIFSTGPSPGPIYIVLNPEAEIFLFGDTLCKRDILVLVLGLFIVWYNGINVVGDMQQVVNTILTSLFLIK